jgi:N-acetyl sugar amidotransferase
MIGVMEQMGFEITHVHGLTDVYGPAAVCVKRHEWNDLDISERVRPKVRQGVRYHLQQSASVLDLDPMQPVPAGGETMGEIMFRGNITMKGYLKNERSTQAAFSGGWVHSGNLVVMYPDSYVRVKAEWGSCSKTRQKSDKNLGGVMGKIDYKICRTCIMDTSDPNIVFDNEGVCDYCNNFNSNIKPNWDTGELGRRQLLRLADTIKTEGKGRDFDCIIGLSGGLDSSYTAYLAREEMGLRPLLFHVDAGWNSDQAVSNIEKLVNGLGLDLHTDVVNWEAVKRMQVAFLRAGIPDQDLVQDAAFFSGLYRFAREYKIRHIITGSNFSTECCREPEEWGGYLGIDKKLFDDIWAKFGDGKENNDFPLVDILVSKLWYQRFLGIKVHHPLNLVPYVKRDAEDELEQRFGWRRFQHKHHESRFTRFYEDYWLPRRFGFEKRRAHFSSLIMTGQMRREQALDRISRPEMDEHYLKQEFEYVAHKLGLTVDDLRELFKMPRKTYRDYKNKRILIGMGATVMRSLGMEKRYFR